MVVDGNRRVLEWMAGQDAGNAFVGIDDPVGEQVFEARNGRGGSRFAAEAIETDLGLGVDDFLVGNGEDYAVTDLQGPQAFFEVYRPGDLDCRRAGVRRKFLRGQLGIEILNHFVVHMPAIPAQLLVVE